LEIYQTPTSKKKGIYHIFLSERENKVNAHCAKGVINLNYYKANKPEISKYIGQDLCPLCVGSAYKYGWIHITPIV
jgi:hypothetical protein